MKKYDVVGIGSALLDFTYEVDDSLINDLGLKKGEMQLIDNNKSKEILKKLVKYPVKISPGGSSSNTVAGVAFLGGKSVLLGKVGKDEYGKIYETMTKESNVISRLKKHEFEITGHAITFINPDGQRSFATNLGASQYLVKEDLDEEYIRDSKFLHIEGYLLENPNLRSVVLEAIKIAKISGTIVSLDLSDSGLIKRNLDLFKEFVKEYVDIVFANETEAKAFTDKEPGDAVFDISDISEIAVVKLGENGSLLRSNKILVEIPAYKNPDFKNTNGAGDSFAAGFLFGLVNELDLEKSGKLASYVASLVVGNSGARLEKSDLEKITKFRFTKLL